MTIYNYSYTSPLGTLDMVSNGKSLIAIAIAHTPTVSLPMAQDDIIMQTMRELDEYFSGKRRQFTVPLAPIGTTFQQQVWRALLSVPYGETRSYQQIAMQIGKPTAYRAVGMANHYNPIPIIIPCHRVIGSNHSLTGYAEGLDIKQKLLTLEAQYLSSPNQ